MKYSEIRRLSTEIFEGEKEVKIQEAGERKRKLQIRSFHLQYTFLYSKAKRGSYKSKRESKREQKKVKETTKERKLQITKRIKENQKKESKRESNTSKRESNKVKERKLQTKQKSKGRMKERKFQIKQKINGSIKERESTKLKNQREKATSPIFHPHSNTTNHSYSEIRHHTNKLNDSRRRR